MWSYTSFCTYKLFRSKSDTERMVEARNEKLKKHKRRSVAARAPPASPSVIPETDGVILHEEDVRASYHRYQENKDGDNQDENYGRKITRSPEHQAYRPNNPTITEDDQWHQQKPCSLEDDFNNNQDPITIKEDFSSQSLIIEDKPCDDNVTAIIDARNERTDTYKNVEKPHVRGCLTELTESFKQPTDFYHDDLKPSETGFENEVFNQNEAECTDDVDGGRNVDEAHLPEFSTNFSSELFDASKNGSASPIVEITSSLPLSDSSNTIEVDPLPQKDNQKRSQSVYVTNEKIVTSHMISSQPTGSLESGCLNPSLEVDIKNADQFLSCYNPPISQPHHPHLNPYHPSSTPVTAQPSSRSNINSCNVITNTAELHHQEPAGSTKNEWSYGIFGGCGNCKICTMVACCYPCSLYHLSTSLDEAGCLGWLNFWCPPCLICSISIPGGMLALRAKMRTKYNIKGSISEDMCCLTFCQPCAVCQMLNEIEKIQTETTVKY